MTTEHIFKDVCILYSRLFDHQPVLQGNINLFLKEFQEKRGDREMNRLQFVSDSTQSISQQVLPDINRLLEEHLTQLAAKVSIAKEMSETIVEAEGKNGTSYLEEQRAARKEIWSQFMAGQIEKSTLVDQDYNKQVQDVQDYYNELETKLSNAVKPVL